MISMVEGTLLATNVVWFSSIFFSSNFSSSIFILWCVRWTSFDSPDLRVMALKLIFLELKDQTTGSLILACIEKFQLTADDVSGMAFEISVQKRDPAEVAREWMNNNKATVDGWLGL